MKPSSAHKRSASRRVFSSEARYVHGSFSEAQKEQSRLETQRSLLRNEQWIYL